MESAEQLRQRYVHWGWISGDIAAVSGRFLVPPALIKAVQMQSLRTACPKPSHSASITSLREEWPQYVGGYQALQLTALGKETIAARKPLADGDVSRPFVLTLMSPWQEGVLRRLLKLPKNNFIMMDGGFRTNCLNYTLLVALAVDEHGNGVPVAFGITSSHEGADAVCTMLEHIEARLGSRIENVLTDKGTVSGCVAW